MMAPRSLRKTSKAANLTNAVPARGHVFTQVTLVTENGFTLRYALVEVPAVKAQEAIRHLYFDSEVTEAVV